MDTAEKARTLALAMVNTVRESLLVLDGDLRVVAASRYFYATFETTPEETIGQLVYQLGAGGWNIPALRILLEQIIPEHGVMDDFEVEQTFPGIGLRIMLLNARKVFYEDDHNTTLLLAMEDITQRRATERHLEVLSGQKDTLLQEMNHRVANSLQIIASILMLKARSVQSDETRGHLEDAHRRVLSIASLQQQLTATRKGEEIDIATYLTALCKTLTGSMIGEGRAIELSVVAGPGAVLSDQAISLGLIVTELVINAIKHAFAPGAASGHIIVGYETDGGDWKLSVSDNGRGMSKIKRADKPPGLGTTLVKALAQQLEGTVETVSSATGTTVSVARSTFQSRLPTAA